MAYQLVMKSPAGPRGMRRVYKKARNESLKSAGEFWRHQILPEHFEASASGKYRYKSRTKAHERRKRREGRGNRPNVYTGRLRKAMLNKRPSMKMTKAGLVMIWRGLPRYTYITDTVETIKRGKRKGESVVVKRPNKPAELTAMTKADANLVARAYSRGFERRLKKFGAGR
jgi:hypothetical protein